MNTSLKSVEQLKTAWRILLSSLIACLFTQQGSADNCQSRAQIPSTAYFELARHQQSDFAQNGELVHVKIVKYQKKDNCGVAFRIKWIADDGALIEKHYDAINFELIDADDIKLVNPSATAMSDPNGNGPGGGPGSGPSGGRGGGGGPGGGSGGGPGGGPGGGGGGNGGGGGGPGN